MAWTAKCKGCGLTYAKTVLRRGTCAQCQMGDAPVEPKLDTPAPGPEPVSNDPADGADGEFDQEPERCEACQSDDCGGDPCRYDDGSAEPEPRPTAPAPQRARAPKQPGRPALSAAKRIPDPTLLQMLEMRDKGETTQTIAAVLGLRPAIVGAALDELAREGA